jgi:hypothetical protein
VAFAGTSYVLKDEYVWDTVGEWFVEFGKPELIHSDNGSSFTSNCKFFYKFLLLAVFLTITQGSSERLKKNLILSGNLEELVCQVRTLYLQYNMSAYT